MSKDIKKELLDAKKLYKSKNYREALEIYEKHYPDNSEEFNKWDKIFNYTEDEFLYNKQDYGFYDQYRLSSKRAYNNGYNLYYK